MTKRWFQISPVPPEAIDAKPAAHTHRGVPQAIFAFHSDRGLVGYVYRYKGSDGTPRDEQLVYCGTEAGKTSWRWNAIQEPRPLYGIARLALLGDDRLVIVHDDLASVDAGYRVLPMHGHVAWLGGARGVRKAAWKVLAGRKVLLWPSADAELRTDNLAPLPRAEQPLMRAAKQLATLLARLECEVRILEPPEPEAIAPGFNLAAIAREGWQPADISAWMDGKVRSVFSVAGLGYGSSTPDKNRSPGPAINPSDLITNERGQLKPCEHNAALLIRADGRFASIHHDEFLCRARAGERDWSDHDDLETLCTLQASHRITFSPAQVRNAVQKVAYERRRDSLRDYVRSLPKWDGTPRIEHAFSDAWGAPDESLTRAASKNFFIALIARALRPGAQVDTLWVFEGGQGTYKSKSLRALCGRFHAEITAQVGTTDFMRELRGLWLAELSELDSLRGREASTVKRLLSAPSDRFVEKFQVHATTYPRRAVAVATTNEAAYWQDHTGARRLIPIRTAEISLECIESNRLQWFAEALQAFEGGATWWEFPESVKAAQEERQHVDPWEDTLQSYRANGGLRGPNGSLSAFWPDGFVGTQDLYRIWLHLDTHQLTPQTGARLARVMRRLGYMPCRNAAGTQRGYRPAVAEKPPISSDTPDTRTF